MVPEPNSTTPNRPPSFEVRPSDRIARLSAPATVIVDHLASTAGQFDRLTVATDPSQISATDIVAVSMLGQPVPAAAAAWILSDDGQWLTTEILAQIPHDESIQRCGPATILKMADLFHLLRAPTSQIPERRRSGSLGQATTTRLLAAKRPQLVPIDDRSVRKSLGYSKDDSWWRRWPDELTKETVDHLDDIRSDAALSNPDAARLSDLRIFDILLRA